MNPSPICFGSVRKLTHAKLLFYIMRELGVEQ